MSNKELLDLKLLLRKYLQYHARSPRVSVAARTLETAVTRRLGQGLVKAGAA